MISGNRESDRRCSSVSVGTCWAPWRGLDSWSCWVPGTERPCGGRGGVVVCWSFLPRNHRAPNPRATTSTPTSATSRPGWFLLGGCGGCAVAGGAVERLLPVSGMLSMVGLLVVAHSCLPVSRSGCRDQCVWGLPARSRPRATTSRPQGRFRKLPPPLTLTCPCA